MRLFDKRVVGIDFDSSQIRFVELKGAPGEPDIQNAGSVILPEDTVKEGKINNEENMKFSLNELWSKYKIKTKNVILGISNSDIIMRFINIPKVPIDKISSIIKFQASDYMPVNIDEFELDYELIGKDAKEMNSEYNNSEYNNSEYNILLVAARKKMLYECINVFNSAGLAVRDIKSSTLVMDKLVPENFKNSISAFANISSEVCNILIVNEGNVKFARTVILRESISTVGYIDYITEEIRSSIGYFISQNRDLQVSNVFLLGYNDVIERLYNSLNDNIYANIEILKPYEILYKQYSLRKNYNYNPAEYAIAFSLALHGLEAG
ncbi:MAG: pilus assembly protein PilM [Clostridiaceae bacterium]|nr:pilus assembly protein PilM [Clostridiaceae bacterium]